MDAHSKFVSSQVHITESSYFGVQHQHRGNQHKGVEDTKCCEKNCLYYQPFNHSLLMIQKCLLLSGSECNKFPGLLTLVNLNQQASQIQSSVRNDNRPKTKSMSFETEMLLVVSCVKIAFQILHGENPGLQFNLIKHKHRDFSDNEAIPNCGYNTKRQYNCESNQNQCERRLRC